MSLKEISKGLSFLSNLIKPIIDAGPELERIGNLEDYEKKLTDSVGKLKKQEEEINNRIDNSRNDLGKEIETHKSNIEASKVEIEARRKLADDYFNGKKEEAVNILNNAKTKAQSITDEAQEKAKQIIANAENAIKEQKIKIEEQNKQIAILDKDIAERNASIDEINKTLDKMRNK